MQTPANLRKIAWVGALGLAALPACKQKEEQKLPNFIIFLTDDLGYGDLSCYGNPINSTPNFDRFASEGVRLTDCHAASTISSPSRAGLLTGRNPYRMGFSYIVGGNIYLRDNEVTVAELLKQKGYQTAFFGKWHLSKLEDSTQPDPGDQGFDYWLAVSHNPFEGPRNPQHFIRNGKPEGVMDGWFCDIVVRESLAWLDRIDKSKPFLLVVCTHEPHTPIAPPDSLKQAFRNPGLLPLIQDIPYGGVDREGRFHLDSAANYYGTIRQLDNAFGRFIDGVDKHGFHDNTMMFVTSDNGPEHPVNLEESKGEWDDPIRENCYGTPGILKGMKRYPFEGGHRVPGLVRFPGRIPAGIQSDELVCGADILPTFCDLAGVQIPEGIKLDGDPVMNAFLDRPAPHRQPYLWIFPTHPDTWFRMPHISMRSGDLTLLGWFPQKKQNEKLIPWMENSVPVTFKLFNVNFDPGQTLDLAPYRQDTVKKMSGEMIRLWLDIRKDYINLMNPN